MSLGVSAGLQGRGECCSLTKGTYFLLVSPWPALALELHSLPGTSLPNPDLGYGRQTASAPALLPEPDGDITQRGEGEKREKYFIYSRIAIKFSDKTLG